MDWHRFRVRVLLTLAAIILATLAPAAVQAQFGGGGGGFGGGGFGGGGFGGGGGNFGGGGFGGGGAGNQNAGIVIDAQGVLRVKTFVDPGGLRAKRIVASAMRSLNPELAKRSNMRKVSLTRLEKAVAAQLARGEALTDEMKYLAGLLRVEYVFFYPESGDIVVAGPAEGFAEDLSGRVRGLSTGWPVLELQDLVVALRAYSPSGNKLNVIGVSIDPTQEGLNRMRQYYASIAGRVRPGDANRIAMGMKQSLGQQTVRIDGVSPRTHFAQVMVEADYRMKLIGIGLEAPPVKFKNYVERANSRSIQRNALQRWYFTPEYKCLRVSQDGLAMAMNGWGVRLVSEAELVQEGGIRVGSATVDKASQAFCQAFTEKYPQMARLVPVYAQLRNLIDLAVSAAFIQQKDFYGQANWDLGVFGDEEKYAVETYETPKKVESAVNVVWKGNTLVTPIGGGVHVEPLQSLNTQNLLTDDKNVVQNAHQQVTLKNLPAGQWWWD